MLHEYTLGATNLLLIRPEFNKRLKFTTPDPVKYPVPLPDYLHTHATCAKIAHLSRAGEYIDSILMDLEDTKVLSQDGTSAKLLDRRRVRADRRGRTKGVTYLIQLPSDSFGRNT